MADLFIGINKGGTAKDITTGSSTTSKDIELVIDDTKALSKSDVKMLTQFLVEHLLKTVNQIK